MKINVKYLLLVPIFFAFVSAVTASEVFINKNLNSFFVKTSTQKANATCFMYPHGDFKCACRFSDNSKIWASKELSKITGLSTGAPINGIIKGCSK